MVTVRRVGVGQGQDGHRDSSPRNVCQVGQIEGVQGDSMSGYSFHVSNLLQGLGDTKTPGLGTVRCRQQRRSHSSLVRGNLGCVESRWAREALGKRTGGENKGKVIKMGDWPAV